MSYLICLFIVFSSYGTKLLKAKFKIKIFLAFRFLVPVFMTSSFLRDIKPLSPLKVIGRFGRTYRLHLLSVLFRLAIQY
jgi:hypothetical protein